MTLHYGYITSVSRRTYANYTAHHYSRYYNGHGHDHDHDHDHGHGQRIRERERERVGGVVHKGACGGFVRPVVT